jgi:S1-C subfamily serine protease
MAPSVVGVEAVMSRSGNQVLEQVGTGVIYSSNGYIVTNNHVISSEVTEVVSKAITVTLSNSKKYSASVVGRDTSVDLAVLRIRARSLTAAEFRTDIANVAPGEPVVAIGNAKILKRPVTSGRVIGLVDHANFDKMPGVREVIESSAPLAKANSGGPLVDSKGRVIGINTAETLNGTAISLPADLVVQEVKLLMAG